MTKMFLVFSFLIFLFPLSEWINLPSQPVWRAKKENDFMHGLLEDYKIESELEIKIAGIVEGIF